VNRKHWFVGSLWVAACSHAASPPPDNAVAPARRDMTSPPDLSGHRAVATRKEVIGPTHPVLARHQGQRPILYVARYRGGDPGVPLPPEDAQDYGLELAVFDDGTLAFERPCGERTGVSVSTLSDEERSSLVALVARDCFALRDTRRFYCTHSGHISILCATGSRTADVLDYCPHDDKAKTGFVDHVRAVLHIDDRLRDDTSCSVSARYGPSQTSLTIWPIRITWTDFQPSAP
jgi:hypothetical protein